MERGLMKEMYVATFGTEHGKKVLADILDSAGVGKSLFAVDQRSQDRNVAQHDFAIMIQEQATNVIKE